MAISNPVGFQQSGTYTAALDRLHIFSARHLPTKINATDIAARGGILPGQSARGGAYSMTGWDVSVGRFVGIVENTFAGQGGDYSVLNTLTQALTVTASSPTTNRIDIIGVRVQDAFYSGAINSGDLAVVQGTATAGVPSAPALPSSFLPIVQVTVNANSSTGVLADLRERTSLMGAVYQPYPGQVASNGTCIGEIQLLTASAPYPARLRVWDGSAWRGVTEWTFVNPAVTANAALASNAEHIVSSVSVPDPGFPYKLRTSASLDWAVAPANSPDNPISLSVTLDSTSYATGVISRGNAYSTVTSAANPAPTAQAGVGSTGVLTGAHTIRSIARNSSTGTTMVVRADDALHTTQLSVVMVPA